MLSCGLDLGRPSLTDLARYQGVQVGDIEKILDSQLAQQTKTFGFLVGIVFGGLVSAAVTLGLKLAMIFNFLTEPLFAGIFTAIAGFGVGLVLSYALSITSRAGLRFKIDLMKEFVEAREIVLQREGKKEMARSKIETGANEEVPTAHRTTRNEDFGIERIRFYWDFSRSQLLAVLGIIFTTFVTAASLGNAQVVSSVIHLSPIFEGGALALLGAGVLSMIHIVLFELRKLVRHTDSLLESLRDGKSIPSLRELCKVGDEPKTVWNALFDSRLSKILFLGFVLIGVILLGAYYLGLAR